MFLHIASLYGCRIHYGESCFQLSILIYVRTSFKKCFLITEVFFEKTFFFEKLSKNSIGKKLLNKVLKNIWKNIFKGKFLLEFLQNEIFSSDGKMKKCWTWLNF